MENKNIEPVVFFVVGASKSGTSSLNEYLEQHPDVRMIKYKDIACFFCSDYGMPISLDEYKAMLFPSDGAYKATGDCCHTYLTDPQSAEWIHSEFPRAKIIVILRNPADRAFSQYHWLVANGYEYADTFEKALKMETGRFLRNVRKQPELVQGYRENYLYFRSGLYSRQVARYLEVFPRENILFIKFDDLKENGQKVLSDIFSLIEVDADFVPSLTVYNKRKEPYSIRLQYFMRRYLTRVIPSSLVNILINLNLKSSGLSRFNSSTRNYLMGRFSEDVAKTEALTGLDLSDWRSASESN